MYPYVAVPDFVKTLLIGIREANLENRKRALEKLKADKEAYKKI